MTNILYIIQFCKRSMKIVVYFNSMAPAGGIERVISKHIKFLSQDNEVILLTNDSKPSFYDLPKNVIHESLHIDVSLDMDSRSKRAYQLGSSFSKIVKGIKKMKTLHQPDVFYVASPLGLLQAFVAFRGGKKILVTEHSSFSAYNKFYKLVVKTLYSKVGLLTVPTSDDSKFYSSIGVKNTYLPNPLSFFPEKISNLSDKVILNVGRLTNDKRHGLLIELWSKSIGPKNGWILKIVGKGENEKSIREQIRYLELQDSVFLLPPTKEIEEVFKNSSIFILTSIAEGFGLVLAEAMATGVPCISFNCPSGPKDIIEDGKNGFLIKEGDNNGFVSKLNELIQNEELRKEFGTKARKDILKFDENKIGNKLNGLLKRAFEIN